MLLELHTHVTNIHNNKHCLLAIHISLQNLFKTSDLKVYFTVKYEYIKHVFSNES